MCDTEVFSCVVNLEGIQAYIVLVRVSLDRTDERSTEGMNLEREI